jgi:hypothetical protein
MTRLAMELSWEEILRFIKKEGYVRLFAMSLNPRTKKRFEHFGFKQSARDITTMVREI